jgi:hypothetical protein
VTDYGTKGGTGPNTGKKARKFLCPTPGDDTAPVTKRVFNADGFKRPVALWYEHAAVWHLNTVVDGDNLPEWAKNYTQTEAFDA